MMANRKLPFGYEMQGGEICIQTQEASIVRKIYTAYANGFSYQQLTQHLNAQQIPYHKPDKPWNKNMVARILNHKIYVGNETYPAIITASERHRAGSAKPAAGTPLDASQSVKVIRRLARCAACGGTLTLSSNRYGWARWNCPSCKALTADATTPVIMDDLTYILSVIRRDPKKVQVIPQSDSLTQEKWRQMENNFSDVLHSAEFDEATAKANAIALTAARFDALGSEDYETMRIQYILSTMEQNGELDTDLLRQITSAILIHPTGAVSLKLKNEQIMKRSDFI